MCNAHVFCFEQYNFPSISSLLCLSMISRLLLSISLFSLSSRVSLHPSSLSPSLHPKINDLCSEACQLFVKKKKALKFLDAVQSWVPKGRRDYKFSAFSQSLPLFFICLGLRCSFFPHPTLSRLVHLSLETW